MNEVIALVEKARVRSAELNDQLAATHGINTDHFPIRGLNMANQHCVLALEALLNYMNLWSATEAQIHPNIEQLRNENGQRVIELTKSALIFSLSAFEYCAKQFIALHPGKIVPLSGRIYLRKIIEESVRANLIPIADEGPWEGVIELRNSLVHNNGVADKTQSYAIPGAQNIEFKSGQMITGNLKFFAEVQLWSIESFGRWCDALLK